MPLTVGIRNATEKGFAPNEIELLNSFEMGALAMVAGVGRINPDIENAPDRYNNIGVDEATERFSVAIHACKFVGCAAGRYKPVKEYLVTHIKSGETDGPFSTHDEAQTHYDLHDEEWREAHYIEEVDEELTEWQQELQASERLLFDVLKDSDFIQRMADNEWSCNVSNTSREEFQFRIMKRVAEDTWRKAGYTSYGDKRAIIGAPTLTYKRICKDAELIETLVIKHLGGDAYIHMEDVIQHFVEEHVSWHTGEALSNGMYLHWHTDSQTWTLEDTQQEE